MSVNVAVLVCVVMFVVASHELVVHGVADCNTKFGPIVCVSVVV